MIKLIDTLPPKLERSVNYFENFRAECHLMKIECNESRFANLSGVNLIYPNNFNLRIENHITKAYLYDMSVIYPKT